MVAHANTTMTPRGQTLLGAMRRNLELLVELEKYAPGDVMTIVEALVHHMRAWKPLELGAMPSMVPVELQAPPDRRRAPLMHPASDIVRELCGGTHARIGREDGHVVLVLTDGDDTVAGVMTPQLTEQLRADLLQVLAEVIR